MKKLLDYAQRLKNWFIMTNGDVGLLSVVTTLYEASNDLSEIYQTLSLGVIAYAYYLKNDNLSVFDGDDPKEFVMIDKLAYDLIYNTNNRVTRQDKTISTIMSCGNDKFVDVLVVFSAIVESLMKEGFKRV